MWVDGDTIICWGGTVVVAAAAAAAVEGWKRVLFKWIDAAVVLSSALFDIAYCNKCNGILF